nr:hypothetical protein BaRGS_000678 [Batillaria attramentaria]
MAVLTVFCLYVERLLAQVIPHMAGDGPLYSPLKAHTVMKTRTTLIVIVIGSVLITGLMFVMTAKFTVTSVTTAVTAFKLRSLAAWRGKSTSASTSTLVQRKEVALTRMLMMRAGTIVLILLVSAILLTGRETEGFLFSKDKVKSAIRRAGRWVRDNCNVGLGGVSCRGIKILRRRRSADVTTEHPVTAMLDKVCPKFDVGPNAKMEEVVDAAMMEMDDNKDGTLNTNESVRFTELMGELF